MAFKSPSDDNLPVAEINITPLVDVMLVLLVIFMITAPLMENGIPIELPKASAKAIAKDETPITLALTKDGKMYLNREEIPPVELRNRLITLFQDRPKKEIYIRADGALPYSNVAQAMATIKNTGIHKIGLITQPENSR